MQGGGLASVSFNITVVYLPRQSLRGGRQKSISPQCSGFRKWRSPILAFLKGFNPSTTLVWSTSIPLHFVWS